MRQYRRWTQAEIDFLLKIYPDHSNEYCSQYLHRSKRSCQLMAFKHGVAKSPEFAKQQHEKGQFKKGHVPFNKGKKWEHFMSEEGARNAAKTQFQFHGKPHNTRPDGYEMLRKKHKGKQYWWIKPSDGRKMMPKHRYLWEQAYGEIPKGCCVQFKDGDTTNCVLENLYLINRADQMRENYNKLTDEKKNETHRKIQEARKVSFAKDRLRLKWGMEPKTKLVKRRPI